METAAEDVMKNKGTALTDAGVLVAGAASGLGAATARTLHAQGGHVVVADVDTDGAATVARELGSRAEPLLCDIADAAQVRAAVKAATRAPNGLRAAVVCAGIGVVQGLIDEQGEAHDLELFEKVLRVNLTGTFNILRLAASAMRRNDPDADGGRGVIVLTGSLSGLEGAAGETAYAAAKGGVHALTLPAARDLAGIGVRVVTVAPGSFDTAMMAGMSEELVASYAESIPFPKRFGHAREFASLVEQIVINPMLNGSVVRIDGAVRHH
ncbi:SDR family NAD(P)-dependent oxidoreductase [Streptomyces sp. BH106]|uniref:SDR family NAD(P)-dependent oxidoreductase n=1 Tax=Streptomyces sp. BH106 TaxID=3410409 RepID=UPI003CF95A34